jgi:hypothetical protein
MIASVIRWQNGMVMVFDTLGKQMTDYQGCVDEVREKILQDAPPQARFESGNWQTGETTIINRESL